MGLKRKALAIGTALVYLSFHLNAYATSPTLPDTNNYIYLYGGSSRTYEQQLSITEKQAGTLAPDGFTLDDQGRLQTKIDPDFVARMHALGYRVEPFLSNNWDHDQAVKALDNRDSLASDLVKAVIDDKLDGLNIDLENMSANERTAYTSFLRLVADKLHASGKTLTVAVPPAQSDSSAVGWLGAYDYAAIGQIADTVYLMAYDESYPGGPAGPVAGYAWVKQSLAYVTTKIPPSKLVLGVPFYGRYWNESVQGGGITYGNAIQLIERNHASLQVDPVSRNDYAQFVDAATGRHEVIWLENADADLELIGLAGQYHLKGWGAWCLGQEDPALWHKLSASHAQAAMPPVFADLTGHWAAEAVERMAAGGYLSGYPDGTFRPDASISREETAVSLMRILQLTTDKSASYADVSPTRWSYDDIRVLSVNEIMTGYPGNRFRPGQSITRGEFAATIVRSFSLPLSTSATTRFSDLNGYWGESSILRLAQAGLISGYSDGTFRPDQPITRAEAAAILERILGG